MDTALPPSLNLANAFSLFARQPAPSGHLPTVARGAMLPAVPDDICYTNRLSLFDMKRTLSLRDAALEIDSVDGTRRVAYDQIREMRLLYNPDRYCLNRYHCVLTFTDGERLEVANRLYQGFLSFSDDSRGYVAFVTELARRAREASPQCRFRQGGSAWCYALGVTGALFFVALMLAVIVLLAIPFAFPSLFLIAGIMILLFPAGVYYAIVNAPAAFDPHSIPRGLLPSR